MHDLHLHSRFSLGAAILLVACGMELPPEPSDGTIRGRVLMASEDAASASVMVDTPVTVAAFAAFGAAPPDSSVSFVPGRSLTGAGADYELRSLLPGSYQVVATAGDPLNPFATLATGAYPNFCALQRGAGYLTIIEPNTVLSEVDVSLYGHGSAADPCEADVVSACAEPETSALDLHLESDVRASPSDVLRIALLRQWPATAIPPYFDSKPGRANLFPTDFVINHIEPGSYYLYVCFDYGGDHLRACGDADVWSLFGSSEAPTPIVFEAGKVHRITMEVGSSAGQLDSSASPPCSPSE